MSMFPLLPSLPDYVELHCISNFTFLTGASHPAELIERAFQLGYSGLALTDECSVAGTARAHHALKTLREEAREAARAAEQALKAGPSDDAAWEENNWLLARAAAADAFNLIIGSRFTLMADVAANPMPPPRLAILARNREGFGNLSEMITLGRRRAEKGSYLLYPSDFSDPAPEQSHLRGMPDCLVLLLPDYCPDPDVLRAQVDYQSLQQQLIVAQNSLEKDKLALARAIGLPLDQKFTLTDTAPFQALDTPDPQAAFEQALKQRKDLAAAREQYEAAKSAKKAAVYEQLPAVSFSGDFGDLGTTPAHSHSTYTATATASTPVLQIAKMRGDQETANAQKDQAEAKYSDQLQQVNADVRDSILDIQTAAKLVDAAKSNVDLAKEALSEAQQRYKVGVADSLPVSQAQTQYEQASDQYISALYQHNVAKLALARALGVAASNSKDYLGGK